MGPGLVRTRSCAGLASRRAGLYGHEATSPRPPRACPGCHTRGDQEREKLGM
jgi:hypothetical protein